MRKIPLALLCARGVFFCFTRNCFFSLTEVFLFHTELFFSLTECTECTEMTLRVPSGFEFSPTDFTPSELLFAHGIFFYFSRKFSCFTRNSRNSRNLRFACLPDLNFLPQILILRSFYFTRNCFFLSRNARNARNLRFACLPDLNFLPQILILRSFCFTRNCFFFSRMLFFLSRNCFFSLTELTEFFRQRLKDRWFTETPMLRRLKILSGMWCKKKQQASCMRLAACI